MAPDAYPSEIARLETLVRENPGSAKAGRAQYELALRYMSHENPKPDYDKALQNLESYARSNPEQAEDAEIQDRLAMLYELKRRSRDRRIAKLETELEQSRQANLKLQADNAELNKRIELLKVLDQAVEEKRKNYSSQ